MIQDLRVIKDRKVPQVLLVPQVPRDHVVHKVIKDPRATRDRRAFKEAKVNQETRVRTVRLAHKGRRGRLGGHCRPRRSLRCAKCP